MENLKIPTADDFAFRTKRHFMQDYFSELDADGNLVLNRTEVIIFNNNIFNTDFLYFKHKF